MISKTAAKKAAMARFDIVKTTPDGWQVRDHESHAPAIRMVGAPRPFRQAQEVLKEKRAEFEESMINPD